MTTKTEIKFKCIKVNQPIGNFYIGAIDHKDLLTISFAEMAKISDEQRGVESETGIQRPLSEKRVANLKKYVTTIDSTFPTSIILAIDSENAKFDEESGLMKLKNNENVAKIIDGQHRIAGLEDFDGKDFQLNVTIFIDMDIEDQAMVFATINLEQTKVNRSLAYELYKYTKSRSPQRTCQQIVRLLNKKNASPFKSKIKILGIADGGKEQSLTQATFVDMLIVYITPNKVTDRDLLKRGKKIEQFEPTTENNLIFREFFRLKKDAYIVKNLWNYFKAIEKKWPNDWRNLKRGNILNRSTGFRALMRFLPHIYFHYGNLNSILTIDEYFAVFNADELKEGQFTSTNYKPGSTGEGDLLKDLLKMTPLKGQ